MDYLAIKYITVVLMVGLFPSISSTLPENTYLIQTKVYVDARAVNTWKEKTDNSDVNALKEYIKGVFVNVQESYQSLLAYGSGLKIKFEVDLTILDWGTIILPYKIIEAYSAISYFEYYVATTSKQHDLYYLFTGSDLAGPAEGVAMTGRICFSNAVGIGEFSISERDVIITAHEIGHVLGANHDGYYNAVDCAYNRDFVMNNLVNESPNRHKFSKCSYNLFMNTIKANGSCLTDGDIKNAISGDRLGASMTADEMCKRKLTRKHYVLRSAYQKDNYGDSLCTKLICTSGKRTTEVLTTQGLTCGKNKQCINAKCVEVSNWSPNTLDSCPLGDQPEFPQKGYNTYTSCDDIPFDSCFNFVGTCCQRCANYKMTAADEFCQMKEGIDSAFVRSKYTKGWGNKLCEGLHCATRFDNGQAFFTKVYDTPEGMQCGKNKVCKSKKCVVDLKKGDPSMPDVCPFGDQPWIPNYGLRCAGMMTRYRCSNEKWGSLCCEYCKTK